MDTKNNLWGCGSARANNNKKKSSMATGSINGDDNRRVSLATALIKFMKNRCSSFEVDEKTKRKRGSSNYQEKKHPRKTKAGTPPAVTAVAKKNNMVGGDDTVTLQDWMSVELNAAGANSGEFHVFTKQAAAAYKKIHPSFNRSSRNGVDDTSYGRNDSRRDQHIMEKSVNVDGGAAEVVVAEVASLPPQQSSGDTAKKKVSFRLPLVTNIFIVGSSPDLKN